ncbi:MAG: inositol monophosphatase family protein [Gemmatimonadota bacterium]
MALSAPPRYRGELLEAAERLAIAAGALTLRYFGTVLSADSKADGTPVTLADREAEVYLREEIRRAYPTHGVLGEEFGEERGETAIRWILDPIDGTKSFMRGVPLYGVLIGIEVEGEATVGVAHFPALSETISAATGLGCRWRAPGSSTVRSAQVSGVSDLDAAALLLTDPKLLLGESAGGADLRPLTDAVSVVRGWGDAYGHLLVATGRADIMVDPVLSVWDTAPFLPILREAGGRFTDRSGVETIHGHAGISSNGILHDQVLERLNPPG